MKKRLLPFILVTVLCVVTLGASLAFAASPDKPFLASLLGGNERFEQAHPTGNFTITYNANGGTFSSEGTSLSQPVSVKAGDKIDEPLYPPSKSGKVFEGWFLDTEGRAAWHFDDSVYSNVTLYAKFNDGVNIYKASDEQLTIYSDAAKYNNEREAEITAALKNEVRAKYLGEAVATTISNPGTFRLEDGFYPVGEHNVTFRATAGGLAKTLGYKVNVIDGPTNKIYISTKASVQELGGEAYGYFGSGRKDIGVALNHYFDLTNTEDLTDYSISNAVSRSKLGLPRELLSGKYTLKQFADPILIRNNSGEDVWYKLDTTEHIDATFVLFDESGAVVEGYDGPNRRMYSEKHYNAETSLASANATFLSDREIPDGYFLLVIGHNANKGNFYKSKASLGSSVASTYDYDGRKFALSAIMYHYNNTVQIRVGDAEEGTLLTTPYANQKPYILSGEKAITGYIGLNTIDKDFALKALTAYDDNGTFAKDESVPSNRISVGYAKIEGDNFDRLQASYDLTAVTAEEESDYYARITIADNSADPDKALVVYRKVLLRNLVNNYTHYDGADPFAHSHATTEGVRLNTIYSPWGGVDDVVYVYDNTAAKYFNSYTADCQWSTVLILKKDGSVVYGVNSQGVVYSSAGANLYSVTASGNIVANFYKKVKDTTATPTDADIRAFLTSGAGTDPSGANGPYYMAVYPNASGGGNYARNYVNAFLTAFAANPSLKLTIKGTGVEIGV